ncbi:MAG: haloacid dehalogenase [Deltaproteobacteria bacterium]|nr:MAG: haloacid dehalogenase [Deltaproteobacteria bacterium]
MAEPTAPGAPARAGEPTPTTIDSLIARYDVLLFDAYGVLVSHSGALPGAREALDAIDAAGKRFFVVTNDASKLPATAAARYRAFGLPVTADHMITSGMLLADAGLAGAACMVLGTPDTVEYVRAAGGVPVPPAEDGRYDAVIVGDDAGYPFLDTLDVALTALYRHIDRGDPVRLLLPNPDLVYPKGPDRWGFTAGGAAMLIEAALARRFPRRAPRFERLGKPNTPLFDLARRRAGTDAIVMIGDQLETDIAGARAAGIDAALLATGVSRWADRGDDAPRPTYLLATIAAAK